MTVLAQLLIAAALVATAVIYGTDIFAAIVLRPALAHVDDRTLTGTTGYMGPRHQRPGGAADGGRRGPMRRAHPVLTKRLAARSRITGGRLPAP